MSSVRVCGDLKLSSPWQKSDVARLYDQMADIYEYHIDTEFNLRLARELTEAVVRELGKAPRRLLDFGCGTGLSTISAQSVLTSFEDWQVTGTDISTHMIMKARERGLNAIHNNEIDTVCKAVKFDALIACNVVHYFVGLEEFRFWSRLLSVDGIAVFNFRLPKINPNSKERESLFAGLRMAGFEPIRDYLSSIKTEKREYSPWIIVTRVMS